MHVREKAIPTEQDWGSVGKEDGWGRVLGKNQKAKNLEV